MSSLPDSLAAGFLVETKKAAIQDFDWGLRLAEALAAEGRWDSVGPALRRSWAEALFDDAQWIKLLDFIHRNRETWRPAYWVADLLLHTIERRDVPATRDLIVQGIALAEALWSSLGRESAEDSGGQRGWVDLGLNQPGGMLGAFAVHAMSRLYQTDRETWSGIPQAYRPFLGQMAVPPDGSPTLARAMLCGQLNFWFAVDPQWTRATLFPLFKWTGEDRLAPEQAWHGILTSGHQAPVLIAELMPFVRQTFMHLSALGAVRRRFAHFLVSIAYDTAQDPLKTGWLKDFLQQAEPSDRREFAQAIRAQLNGLGLDERHRLWQAWLRSYLARRLDEWRIPFENDEWTEIIAWVLPLAGMLQELVPLLRKHLPEPQNWDSIYYKILDCEDLFRNPNELTDLLGYLIDATAPLSDCDYLVKIIDRLLGLDVEPEKLRALAERLASLGCPDAQGLAARVDRA